MCKFCRFKGKQLFDQQKTVRAKLYVDFFNERDNLPPSG
jgi:hypothetical protein